MIILDNLDKITIEPDGEKLAILYRTIKLKDINPTRYSQKNWG